MLNKKSQILIKKVGNSDLSIKKMLWFFFICAILSIYNISYADYLNNLNHEFTKIDKPINGKVTSALKGTSVINKGSQSGVKTGMQVNIYENFGTYRLNGKSIILKKLICYGVVKKTYDNKSEVIAVYGVDEETKKLLYLIPDGWKYKTLKIKAGDLFSINSGRQKAAILTRNPVLYNTLKSALVNFDVASNDWVNEERVALKIYGMDRKKLSRLAFKLGIDYFLIPTLSKNNNAGSLNILVIGGLSGMTIDNISTGLNQSDYSLLENKIQNSTTLINPDNVTASNLDLEYKKTILDKLFGKIGISIHHGSYQKEIAGTRTVAIINDSNIADDLAIKNVNGNKEFIVLSDGRAVIYSYSNGDIKKIQELSAINSVSVELYKQFLILSGFDRYGAIKSLFYKLDHDHKFIKMAEDSAWMRFVHWNGNVVAARQAGSIDSLFSSKLYLYHIKNDSLVKFKDISYITKKTAFFNWDTILIGHNTFMVYLSRNGNVVVEKNRKVISESKAVFGFGKNRIVRYPRSYSNSSNDNKNAGTILIHKPIKFFYENGKLEIAVMRNYKTSVLNTPFTSSTGGSALWIYVLNKDGLHRQFASGNIFGRISAAAIYKNMLLLGRAVPSDFFRNLLQGEKEKGLTTYIRILR